jgi:hypothetical protein
MVHLGESTIDQIQYYSTIYSEVFKARCKKTGKLVAFKRILMENEKEGVYYYYNYATIL